MENINLIPEWLGATVIGAVVAALGYVCKLLIESWRSIRDVKNARHARLIELKSLLSASWVSFKVQNNHAADLLSMIQKNHGIENGENEGYEDFFAKTFNAFTPEEKELHTIIRSFTIYALQPTNKAISEWLKNDKYFKAQKKSGTELGNLAKKLDQLEVHLILWLAKYELWIPQSPEHALVYLNDEKKHGTEFPTGIDKVLSKLC